MMDDGDQRELFEGGIFRVYLFTPPKQIYFFEGNAPNLSMEESHMQDDEEAESEGSRMNQSDDHDEQQEEEGSENSDNLDDNVGADDAEEEGEGDDNEDGNDIMREYENGGNVLRCSM